MTQLLVSRPKEKRLQSISCLQKFQIRWNKNVFFIVSYFYIYKWRIILKVYILWFFLLRNILYLICRFLCSSMDRFIMRYVKLKFEISRIMRKILLTNSKHILWMQNSFLIIIKFQDNWKLFQVDGDGKRLFWYDVR